MSRSGACDVSLIEGVCWWGSCYVEGHCLSLYLFDCRSVDLKITYLLTRLVTAGMKRGHGEVGQR